jgi:response regulator of citrate/malate metabolism
MATTMTKMTRSKACKAPRVLVVDDEPNLVELVGDVTRQIHGNVITATNVAQARKILASQEIEVLVLDVHLPDGDGLSLLPAVQQKQPTATTIVMTGEPSVDRVISAMRQGAVDFLPKPFSADQLRQRLSDAMARQHVLARNQSRLDRLRQATKRLNAARKTVSQKVDLLCNDLIGAYGSLAKELNELRTQDGFRQLLAQARDLEQLLCHAMDGLLRQMGYCNVAVWLASDEGEFQLGAYMKYTIPGEPEFTQTLREGLLPMVQRQGMLHLGVEETQLVLSDAELKYLKGNTVLASNCTYLGESLAAIVLFRDGCTPFTDEHAKILKVIAPIFAVALGSMVHEKPTESPSGFEDSDNPPMKGKEDSADWWKRGEAPPF